MGPAISSLTAAYHGKYLFRRGQQLAAFGGGLIDRAQRKLGIALEQIIGIPDNVSSRKTP
ncbi:MAG: hypothetical protein ACM335_07950 [Deltaproteobacteria bacterium]